MRFASYLLFLLALTGAAPATQPATQPADDQPDAFVIALIDAKTEQRIGPFPYDRSMLAQAVEASADLGARGVVLKFFLDLPRSSGGDDSLAHAMARIPVVLQAAVASPPPSNNQLPDRFLIPGLPRDPRTLGGSTGYVPLPAFSAAASDVGFANVRNLSSAPIIDGYGQGCVKSLWLCCLEMVAGDRARVRPGESLTLAGKTIKLNSASEIAVKYPDKDNLDYVSFCDLTSEAVPWEKIQNRVVIIAYDGHNNPQFDTPMGKLGADRAFIYGLFSLYRQLAAQ